MAVACLQQAFPKSNIESWQAMPYLAVQGPVNASPQNQPFVFQTRGPFSRQGGAELEICVFDLVIGLASVL